jgi:hypothetical protein
MYRTLVVNERPPGVGRTEVVAAIGVGLAAHGEIATLRGWTPSMHQEMWEKSSHAHCQGWQGLPERHPLV